MYVPSFFSSKSKVITGSAAVVSPAVSVPPPEKEQEDNAETSTAVIAMATIQRRTRYL